MNITWFEGAPPGHDPLTDLEPTIQANAADNQPQEANHGHHG
jgi:hypothetical protein